MKFVKKIWSRCSTYSSQYIRKRFEVINLKRMRHSGIFYLGDHIRGGGQFVLAQEQDWEPEEQTFTYNSYEAFLGDMSQMTVWNTVLSPQDIYNLAGSCSNAKDDYVVISWADFVENMQGVYRKSSKSHVCDCKFDYHECTRTINNVKNYILSIMIR